MFDEDDMKRMTEMSPRELTQRAPTNHPTAAGPQHPSSFNFDDATIHIPQMIKSIFKKEEHQPATVIKKEHQPVNSEGVFGNRVRSISYQQNGAGASGGVSRW